MVCVRVRDDGLLGSYSAYREVHEFRMNALFAYTDQFVVYEAARDRAHETTELQFYLVYSWSAILLSFVLTFIFLILEGLLKTG